MRNLITLSLLTLGLTMASAWADNASPVGVWKNLDDVSGKPKALVRITEKDGVLSGRIEKLFRPADQEQNPKCAKCPGVAKDQPLVGLMMMWGLKQNGDGYDGGEILDPANGKVYKSKMRLIDGGKKLDVRGYVGVPMFGRTQTWERAE